MTQFAMERFESQLATLDKLVQWMKALLTGAFLLGAWVTTQQLRITYIDDRVTAIEADRKAQIEEYRRWREQITTDLSDTRNDVLWIRRSMENKR